MKLPCFLKDFWRAVLVGFLLFCFPNTSWSVGEYSVMTDSLEFEHATLKSGPDGNISRLLFSGKGKSVDEQPFLVDELHRELSASCADAQKTSGDTHNTVVASLALYVKAGDHIYCYSKMLGEGDQLAFVSGASRFTGASNSFEFIGSKKKYPPKGPTSTTFDPMNLMENFNDTLSLILPIKEHLEAAIPNLGTQREVLVQAQQSLSAVVSSPDHGSFLSLQHNVQTTLEHELDQAVQSLSPYIDSEQYLLYYLKENAVVECDDLQKSFTEAYNAYVRQLLKKPHAAMSRLTKEKNLTGVYFELFTKSMAEYSKLLEDQVKKFAAREYLGLTLHLHSTREMCLGCGALLFIEQNYQHIFRDLLTEIKQNDSSPNPFFKIMVSFNTPLTEGGGVPPVRDSCFSFKSIQTFFQGNPGFISIPQKKL